MELNIFSILEARYLCQILVFEHVSVHRDINERLGNKTSNNWVSVMCQVFYIINSHSFINMWKTQINVPHFSHLTKVKNFPGLPWLLNGKESACQCRRQEIHPWVRKTPWKRKWQPIPVSLPGKSHGWRSLGVTVQGVTKELDKA